MFLTYSRWRAPFTQPHWHDDPVPVEIYSVDRLELYAENLARTQEVSAPGTAGISLRGRLRSQALVLNAAFRALNAGIQKGDSVTPAAAWLVDNFYIVDEHLKAVHRDLPSGFYKELPKLSNGPLRGYPRVYGLVVGLVAHSDNLFDLDTLHRYCRAYQRVQPLTIGELWAVAITLRVVLIENLSRMSGGIVTRLMLREKANALADKLLPNGGTQPAPLAARLPADDGERLAAAYAAQLFQRLRDHDPKTTPALTWLHDKLAAQNTSPDEVVHAEHQRQGAVNLSVRNVITSLRLVSAVDWAKFFESISLVDELLCAESSYAAFDFPTRDLYRHAIEDLSRRSPYTELEVARRVLAAAKRAAALDDRGRSAPRTPHALEPGYYLVSAGRIEFERELNYRIPWKLRFERATCAAGISGYAGAILALSIVMDSALILGLRGHAHLDYILAMSLLGLLAASEVAAAAVNLWVTHFCSARVLPALELKDGVPREYRTIVAVPILLTTIGEIVESVRALEVHFLATQDGDIRFALLSDWLDSDSEHAAGDEDLLSAAAAGVAKLNGAYGGMDGGPRFMLLHRRRLWNQAQGRWMGWERKRGKLHELNCLLRGSERTSFMNLDGLPPAVPSGVRYVISLDSDTRLPRGAAAGLIGKMAHPLNSPLIDAAKQRVTSGYGILQPRVTPSLPEGHEASIFQNIFSGPSGIDPYAFAVSDVYQDLFGEGSYSGKGIYDVDAFEKTLANRVPENRMLSHDLFEGIYARSGLASDVEVVEEYPSRYDVATARQHRWTRGDWQLLPWVVGRRSSLPGLGRWKMADNLRRSLVAPAALLGLILSWIGPAPLGAGLLFLGAVALPVLLPFLVGLVPTLSDFNRSSYLARARKDAAQMGSVIALRLLFLADQAWVMMDAIVRTLYRLAISHTKLLEWTTTAQSKTDASSSRIGYYRSMSGGVLLALLAALLALISGDPAYWPAIPFLSAWCFAPLVARAISRPSRKPRNETLSGADVRQLRLQARQTWSFFDTFVNAAQNMLPPDNFQETPNPVVANRTSPTNMGLYLLSVAAAREFGWIGSYDALERLEATLSTLDRLETFRGHFYNWYDTHDLRPLDPKYISTVDSGNLAGHLLTLAGAMSAWLDAPAPKHVVCDGILDTIDQMQGVVLALEQDDRRNYGVSPRQLSVALDAVRASVLTEEPCTPEALLDSILKRSDAIGDLAQAVNEERGDGAQSPLLEWSRMLRSNVTSHQRDLQVQAHGPDDYRSRIGAIARRARNAALAMEFGFLVRPERQLLSIGYRVAERAQDPSCYDLLASEARLASFVAIAKGDLPVRHWFRLGRRLTPVGRGSALVSWSGSMFEYLMPVLVMREPQGSLLGRNRAHDREAPDPIRRRTTAALGRFGVGPQRARSGTHLSVLELRRAGLGFAARFGRRGGGSPLRQRARRNDRSQSLAAKSRAAAGPRRARPVRMVRRDGLHADAAAGRRLRRAGARLHGSPPGNAPDLDCQRLEGRHLPQLIFIPTPSFRRPNCCCRRRRREMRT